MTDKERVEIIAWIAQLQGIIRTARSIQGDMTRKREGASGFHKPATEDSTSSSATNS